jgi:hypothetical protein
VDQGQRRAAGIEQQDGAAVGERGQQRQARAVRDQGVAAAHHAGRPVDAGHLGAVDGAGDGQPGRVEAHGGGEGLPLRGQRRAVRGRRAHGAERERGEAVRQAGLRRQAGDGQDGAGGRRRVS